jgi:hypothetical protein
LLGQRLVAIAANDPSDLRPDPDQLSMQRWKMKDRFSHGRTAYLGRSVALAKGGERTAAASKFVGRKAQVSRFKTDFRSFPRHHARKLQKM